MSNYDNGDAVAIEVYEFVHQLDAVLLVLSIGWLVEEEQFLIGEQHSCYAQSAFLALTQDERAFMGYIHEVVPYEHLVNPFVFWESEISSVFRLAMSSSSTWLVMNWSSGF